MFIIDVELKLCLINTWRINWGHVGYVPTRLLIRQIFANYTPISITPTLSKVFERLMSVGLGRFVECRDVDQPPSSIIGKVLALVLLCRFTQYRTHWRENRRLLKCSDRLRWSSLGVRGSVLSALTEALSNRSQYMSWWMVVGQNWCNQYCQECIRAVFWGPSCSSWCTKLFSFTYCKPLYPVVSYCFVLCNLIMSHLNYVCLI